MISILPAKLNKLAAACPFPLYVVGGSVRDFIAGLISEKSDYDICAPAAAEDFMRIAEGEGFTIDAVYKNTGTVKLSCEGEDFEYTAFRSDEYVRGTHQPVNTYFTDDINLDAKRRDFKCNAIYYDIKARKIVDPLGGVDDIYNKRISTVAPAEKVFGEDGLRLMRLARFAAQTGFVPTDECISGAKANAELIKDVSAERIYAELNLILSADKKFGLNMGQYVGLKILKSTGVLQLILPEICAGDGVEQRKDFHKYDVLEHSLRAAAYADGSVRLAALLHDVGKPYCFKILGNFIGHEDEGARIAVEICERLKVPKKLTEEISKLIELHMYDFRCDAKENKVRKFIVENIEILDKLLLLKQADYSACCDDFTCAPTVNKFKAIYAKMLEEDVPLTLKELNLKGNDLLEIGIPAAEVGNVLHKILMDCAIKLVPNEKELLFLHAKKVYLPNCITAAKRKP